MQSADEIGLPNVPEFLSIFAGHIEWEKRVAITDSELSENTTTSEEIISELR